MDNKPELADVLQHYGADLSAVPPGDVWTTILCPFHSDTVPSAGVNLGDQRFRCHRCGMGGDAINLIRDKEGLGFRAALEWAQVHVGYDHGAVRQTANTERYRPFGREESD